MYIPDDTTYVLQPQLFPYWLYEKVVHCLCLNETVYYIVKYQPFDLLTVQGL